MNLIQINLKRVINLVQVIPLMIKKLSPKGLLKQGKMAHIRVKIHLRKVRNRCIGYK